MVSSVDGMPDLHWKIPDKELRRVWEIATQAIRYGSMLNKNMHYAYLLIQLPFQVLSSPSW